MSLSIVPFERAILRLQEGLERYRCEPSDDQIRDGLIQRFEFTYDLSHKILRRYLAYASADPEQFDQMPFQSLIRTANVHGLLFCEWSEWSDFRKMRAKSSHVYDEDIALEVVDIIPNFLTEAIFLRDRLQERLA